MLHKDESPALQGGAFKEPLGAAPKLRGDFTIATPRQQRKFLLENFVKNHIRGIAATLCQERWALASFLVLCAACGPFAVLLVVSAAGRVLAGGAA